MLESLKSHCWSGLDENEASGVSEGKSLFGVSILMPFRGVKKWVLAGREEGREREEA